MAKKSFSIDLLVDLVKHVPEGYLEWQQIHENFDVKKINGSWKSISKEVSQREVGCKGLTFFDASRVSWRDVCQKQKWSCPQIPALASDGTMAGPNEHWWMIRSDIDEKIGLQYAKSQIKALVQAREEQWKKLLDLCGETIRPGRKQAKPIVHKLLVAVISLSLRPAELVSLRKLFLQL